MRQQNAQVFVLLPAPQGGCEASPPRLVLHSGLLGSSPDVPKRLTNRPGLKPELEPSWRPAAACAYPAVCSVNRDPQKSLQVWLHEGLASWVTGRSMHTNLLRLHVTSNWQRNLKVLYVMPSSELVSLRRGHLAQSMSDVLQMLQAIPRVRIETQQKTLKMRVFSVTFTPPASFAQAQELDSCAYLSQLLTGLGA